MKDLQEDPGLSSTKAGASPRQAQHLVDLADWIDRGWLPEMIPTHQQRSLRTAFALIEAGRRLLLTRSLDDLPVETVCEEAGTTVGAFYGRFENKHAFFVTMQRMQVIRSKSLLENFIKRHEPGQVTLDDVCKDLVTLTVQTFRSNLGILRASLQHTQEGMWTIFKESGDRHRAALTAQLAPLLPGLKPAQRKLRIQFAYQAIAGTLVHIVLNDPGPLGLEEDALIVELTRLVRTYLAAPA